MGFLTVWVLSALSFAQAWEFYCPASQNSSSLTNIVSQSERNILVTGADGRLGYWVSHAALQHDANVILACRNETKCEATQLELMALYPKADITRLIFDLSSFASVREAAQQVRYQFKEIHVLVNNAGTVLDSITEDGYVGTMQVNFYGPALLTQLLMPIMVPDKFGMDPRVVFVGSASAYSPIVSDDKFPASGHVVYYDTVADLIPWSKNLSAVSPYSFYGLSKFVQPQYVAQMAIEYPKIAWFNVAPGFSRDPPDAYPCIPNILFRPCPQWPAQGATGIVFAALASAIENATGANIDFLTNVVPNFQPPYWTQDNPSCVPRPLPGWLGKPSGPIMWSDAERKQYFYLVQSLIQSV